MAENTEIAWAGIIEASIALSNSGDASSVDASLSRALLGERTRAQANRGGPHDSLGLSVLDDSEVTRASWASIDSSMALSVASERTRAIGIKTSLGNSVALEAIRASATESPFIQRGIVAIKGAISCVGD